MRTQVALAGFLALSAMLGPARTADRPRAGAPALAERIFVNADVWTGDPAQPRARALALRGERLLAVGREAEVLALRAPRSVIVDLGGRFVTPGFNDAHLHFLVRDQVELSDEMTLAQIQAAVVEFARAHPGAPWILGRGWGYAAFPQRVPHRRYLDAVVPDRPVFLSERDGHMGLANSAALRLAGLTRATRDPQHGVIERDADGELTGELKEAAQELVEKLIPPADDAERDATLQRLLRRAASYGLTSVQNASIEPGELAAYERAERAGRLSLRLSFASGFSRDSLAADLERAQRLRTAHSQGRLRFGRVKGFVDGTVDARTAAMLEPYTTGGTGLPFWSAQELQAAVAAFDRERFQVQLHAIGDRAIRLALDAFEHAAATNGARERRHRVEHVEVPDPADLRRFAALGVVASTQALFANPDPTTLQHYAVLLGPVRAARANAFRQFDEAGAVQAFGSDWPVFSMEVLRGIYCAAARRTAAGEPAAGYFPAQRISVEAALRHFTRDAAYAEFAEHEKGTLTPGRLADFVVFSDDFTRPPLERVLSARVLATVVGGREVWRASDWP